MHRKNSRGVVRHSGGQPDNQQESSQDKWLQAVDQRVGYYLAGFTDGEGSFNVSLRLKSDYVIGWQVVLSFNVSQRDITNLITLKEILGCGIIKKRRDGVHSFDVTTPRDILFRVIPFFQRFPLRSEKAQRNFRIFCDIAALMHGGNHRHADGLRKILALRETLNEGKGRTRKYSAHDVLQTLDEKSSETIRRGLVATSNMI